MFFSRFFLLLNLDYDEKLDFKIYKKKLLMNDIRKAEKFCIFKKYLIVS